MYSPAEASATYNAAKQVRTLEVRGLHLQMIRKLPNLSAVLRHHVVMEQANTVHLLHICHIPQIPDLHGCMAQPTPMQHLAQVACAMFPCTLMFLHVHQRRRKMPQTPCRQTDATQKDSSLLQGSMLVLSTFKFK